jgi:hypothetical protein
MSANEIALHLPRKVRKRSWDLMIKNILNLITLETYGCFSTWIIGTYAAFFSTGINDTTPLQEVAL